MSKDFVRVDQIEDVLSSLDLLTLVLPLTRKQASYWKWAIIAAHCGFQGAMVCALAGTSGMGGLDEASLKKESDGVA
jgi:hypothetical protein